MSYKIQAWHWRFGHNGRPLSYKEVRTGYDKKFFKLLDNNPGEDNHTVVGDFILWWDVPENLDEDLKSLNVAVMILDDIKEGHRIPIPIHERYRRIKKDGFTRKVTNLEVTKWGFGNYVRDKLGKEAGTQLLERFETSLEEIYTVLKDEAKQKRKLERKKELKKLADNNGLSIEEVLKVRSKQRKKKAEISKVLKQAERTQRIVELAPVLTDIRDEINRIIKNYQEGTGDISYPANKKRTLKKFYNTIKHW